MTGQLTVHHRRTMYLLEKTDEAKAAAGKRVTVFENEAGEIRIVHDGNVLPAHPFHKEDRRVTQAAIVGNKLLSAALIDIKKRQEGHEERRVASAKAKWEKESVRRKFAELGATDAVAE